MTKAKKKHDKHETAQKTDASFNVNLSNLQKRLFISAIVLLPFALGAYYIYYSFAVNKEFCFPLDDPWIHLTFARNLIEFGSFSYFKNEMVTAGSTSPIYTLLLSAGYVFIKNEYYLSYFLGLAAFSGAAFFLYKVGESTLKENWLALVVPVLFALDKWSNFFAASGMETSLYVMLMLAAYFCYIKRKPVAFGLTLGLTIWARPDAIAFIAAIAVDYLVLLYFLKQTKPGTQDLHAPFSSAEYKKLALSFGAVIALYFAMNLYLAGSLLPNTFSAKTAYYSAEFRSRVNFLKFEVWGYFTASYYSLVAAPFIFGLFKLVTLAVKKKYTPLFAAPLYFLFLVTLYWYKLPFAAVKGRYMVPIIAFYLLVAVYGAREFFIMASEYLGGKKVSNSLTIIFFIITAVFSVRAYAESRTEYAEQCHKIAVRNLAAAKWINANTPPDAVIATHDIGALAYYTRRKILDVAGLVSPQFTDHLFDADLNKFMLSEMKKASVGYIAFIREWYQVVNTNTVFSGGENGEEILQVYKFDPDKTHILSHEVNASVIYAMQLFGSKQVPQAEQLIMKLIAADPQSSYSYYLLANAQVTRNDLPGAEKSLKKALEVFPEFREANLMLSDIYLKQKRTAESRNLLEKFLKVYPADPDAQRLFKSATDSTVVK